MNQRAVRVAMTLRSPQTKTGLKTKVRLKDDCSYFGQMKKLLLILTTMIALTGQLSAKEGVILLHGLCRSSASMEKMANALQQAGYVVENVDYPSRTAAIRDLAEQAIGSAIKSKQMQDCSKIHFVTHSMGGILVRSYFSKRKDSRLGRVVMLAPPNQGSEVVDKIGSWRLFRWINGPAGRQLNTKLDSPPHALGKIHFECGVITGDRSINWINSLLIPGKDDGKVSVARSQCAGVKDHRVFHVTHPYIMKNRKVISEVIHFLKRGHFSEPEPNRK